MLTIAGFDPSSGAGVTADLAVFRAHGMFGTAAVTAMTVQSTLGVRRVEALDPHLLRDTLACLEDDLPPAGIKIGMLGSAPAVAVVADFLAALRTGRRHVQVVLDPVLRSSSGRELLEERGVRALESDLLPLVDWVTPNLDELSVLAGVPIQTRTDMERGAEKVCGRFAGLGVVVTGGHLEGTADGSMEDLVVSSDGSRRWLRGEWIQSRSTHGTGCAFASAMACELVLGARGDDAAARAKLYVAGAIRHAKPIGRGTGPMDLGWCSR